VRVQRCTVWRHCAREGACENENDPEEARHRLSFGGGAVHVAQSVVHLIATVGFGVCGATGFAECPSVFDLDHNNGIADVVSTALIATAALGAAVLGARRRPRDVASPALATILFLVTLDDALHLEDNARTAYGVIVIGTISCGAVLTIRVAVGVFRETRWLLLVGTAVLAIDAKAPCLYDQMMNAVGQAALGRGDLLYELGIVLDEGMELAGWTLLAVGLWDAALVNGNNNHITITCPM
jgi:hypothetical protein